MVGSGNFINPYNFIPMGKRKGVADKDEQRRTYTGMIEYSVLTKSPLFIPNTSNDKTFKPSYEFIPEQEGQEHKSYDFFSYHDLGDVRNDTRKPQTWEKQFFRPVIPGSEIRGMFRSNFEILTNSCMSALDTESKLSKRTMERFSAGLLKKHGNFFELYKAEDAIWRTKGANSTKDESKWQGTNPSFYTRQCYIQPSFPEGCHVNFTEVQREANGKKIKSLAQNVSIYRDKSASVRDRKDGYILKGEKGPDINPTPGKVISQKHCCHIFYNPKTKISAEIPVKENQLDLVLQEYEREGINTYDEYCRMWKEFKEGGKEEYFPVYYSQIKEGRQEILFLSPACITREVYVHRLKDMAGDFKPCEDRAKLCPACSLFGTVMEESAVASRIRFSDLEGEEMTDYRQCYEQPVTLPPLSSPKLNNMEFYLKRPDGAWFWTYDYYVDANGNILLQKGELAGRKFYWHNVQNLKSLREEWRYDKTANQLNVTVRPVKDGYRFKGKLYFKKLTQKELDLLIYLINAGDPDALENKNHGYKLGMAKPLGFGSIACHVDVIRLVSYQRKENIIERKEGEESTYEPQIKSNLVESGIEDNFKKMTEFTAASKEGLISYPWNGEEGSEGFQWFVANHGGYNHKKERKEEMASCRRYMLYYEYMEPMKPKLEKTGAGKSSSSQNQNKRYTKKPRKR